MLMIWLSMPAAKAQGINFGNMLRNALSPAAAQCRTLLAWVRTQPPAAASPDAAAEPRRRHMLEPRGLDARTTHLLSDEVFAKHFGKPYEQLTMQDFRTFQQETARACMQGGEFTPAEWQTVQTLWNQHQHARLVQGLQARRAQLEASEREAATAKSEVNQLADELMQAQPGAMTLARLQAIRDRGKAVVPKAGIDAQQAFDAAYQQAVHAVVPTLLRQRLNEALAQARSGDDLAALARARESVIAQASGFGVAIAGDDPALVALQRREQELTLAAAEAERRELAAFADGLPGLEAGVAWHRRFQSRWGSAAGRTPGELGAVHADFRQRREAVLARVGVQLIRAVQQSTSVAEAQSSVARYTLPFESHHPSVQAMVAAVEERLKLIERNEALGRATAPGSAQLAAAPPPQAAAPAALRMSAPPAEASRPGEPSEEVMYELVRTKFDNAAKRVKGLYDQCAGGGDRNNPVNAMMCLGLNMQRGMTGGAAAAPTRIVKFAKIGCEKSPSRPGYNCEYEIQTDSPINKQFASMTGFQLDQAGFGQARFVRNRDGLWLMITGE
ncbi:MAG: hypothetical protein AMXMBFR66_31610 [Pseudomonadota bacterium]|nr:hypothetical protein [Rubrivivax sp.]